MFGFCDIVRLDTDPLAWLHEIHVHGTLAQRSVIELVTCNILLEADMPSSIAVLAGASEYS